MKNIFIGAIVTLIVVVIGYLFWQSLDDKMEVNNNTDLTTTTDTTNSPNTATTSDDTEQEPEDKTKTIIGSSVEEQQIVAYHYGEGDTDILFIGGIHGGYGWNTALVGYELMDYLNENPDSIPEGVRISVIPVLNPDGLKATVGTSEKFDAKSAPTATSEITAGRFNANDVDLNRNFECDWQESGTWQQRKVSGGSQAFSEPESQALRDYVEANKPDAVVAWYSAAGGVFSSNCHEGVLSESKDLTKAYAKASGYKAYEEFNFYEVTGDMVNWLAKEKIPAISVLLTNHTDLEWTKNLKGIEAVLNYYAK